MTDTTKPVEPVAAAKEALLEAADKFFIAKFYIRDEKMLKCCDDKIAEMKTAATALDAANAEIERLTKALKSEQGLSAASKAFHDLAVGERNRAWETIERLTKELEAEKNRAEKADTEAPPSWLRLMQTRNNGC